MSHLCGRLLKKKHFSHSDNKILSQLKIALLHQWATSLSQKVAVCAIKHYVVTGYHSKGWSSSAVCHLVLTLCVVKQCNQPNCCDRCWHKEVAHCWRRVIFNMTLCYSNNKVTVSWQGVILNVALLQQSATLFWHCVSFGKLLFFHLVLTVCVVKQWNQPNVTDEGNRRWHLVRIGCLPPYFDRVSILKLLFFSRLPPSRKRILCQNKVPAWFYHKYVAHWWRRALFTFWYFPNKVTIPFWHNYVADCQTRAIFTFWHCLLCSFSLFCHLVVTESCCVNTRSQHEKCSSSSVCHLLLRTGEEEHFSTSEAV